MSSLYQHVAHPWITRRKQQGPIQVAEVAVAEATRNGMLYDRLIQNENVNRKELVALLVGNTKQLNQLTAGVDAQANLAAMQAAAGKPPAGGEGAPGAPPMVGGAGIAPGGLPQ